MSTLELGESLVGAYMRYIECCTMVLYNNYLAAEQGEVDVVAVKPQRAGEPRIVYFCEVTTHVGGMGTKMVKKVPSKLERARAFAEVLFPDEERRFQWWSPYVRVGAATTQFAQLQTDWADQGLSLEFVVNEEYTRRITQLIEHARKNPSPTRESAYRMLQIVTRLRGAKPQL